MTVTNEGLLKSGGIGVLMDGATSIFHNSGKVKAEGIGVEVAQAAHIHKSGLIRSRTDDAVFAHDAVTMTNAGKVKGDVTLSGMDDSYYTLNTGVTLGAIHGQGGSDDLRGGRGRDEIDGGDDNDTLRGGGVRDLLIGGAGSDYIEGGRGKDLLYGNEFAGGGIDADNFDYVTAKVGRDRIMDFDDGMDHLRLNGTLLSGPLASPLPAALSENAAGDAVLNLNMLGDFKGQIIFEGLGMASISTADFFILL